MSRKKLEHDENNEDWDPEWIPNSVSGTSPARSPATRAVLESNDSPASTQSPVRRSSRTRKPLFSHLYRQEEYFLDMGMEEIDYSEFVDQSLEIRLLSSDDEVSSPATEQELAMVEMQYLNLQDYQR